jgi:hypothetical protein
MPDPIKITCPRCQKVIPSASKYGGTVYVCYDCGCRFCSQCTDKDPTGLRKKCPSCGSTSVGT